MELHPMLDSDTTPNTGLWYVLSTFGDCPSIRVGHTVSFVKSEEEGKNGRLFVIGGANPSGAFCDTFVLDLNTMQWDMIDFPGFRARYEHAAFIPSSQPDKIYIFGGADQTGNMNDIQVLDTKNNSWSTPSVSGTPPSPRTYHTTAIAGDNFIVYSGGHSGPDPVADRQVYSFNASTLTWTKLNVKGDSPKARHGHVSVAVGNKFYIHGGMAGSSFYDDIHVLDLDKKSWSNIKRKKVYPSARAAHSCTAVGTDLYLFGGMNRDGALDDLYKFDTVSQVWTKIELCGPPPACRLDFGICTMELHRSIPTVTDDNDDDDIVSATKHVQEVLDRELKPGSASSRESRQGTGSASSRDSRQGTGSASSRDSRQETIFEKLAKGDNVTMNAAEPLSDSDEETPRPDGVAEGASCMSDRSESKTMTFVLVNGGMDTEGEIFDDSLVYLVEN